MPDEDDEDLGGLEVEDILGGGGPPPASEHEGGLEIELEQRGDDGEDLETR